MILPIDSLALDSLGKKEGWNPTAPTPGPAGNSIYEFLDFDRNAALYFADGQANTLGINREYEELTGLHQESVYGKNLRELEGVFFKPSVTLKVLQANRSITIPQNMLVSNKKLIVTGNPIYNHKGEIALVVTVVKPLEDYISSLAFETAESLDYKIIGSMVVHSPVMQEVMEKVAKIAGIVSNVVITGESGVGKELMAQTIHDFSGRKKNPFVTVNMAAIPENLIESELFGYVGGAFTGANPKGNPGFVKSASGGTLFLDEIGELPQHVQVKLLRLLEQREIIPVGSSKVEQVDIRVICATNRDLHAMVREGKLRKDLYYRLNVFNIDIPPLRERTADIPPLAHYFLQDMNRRFKTGKTYSQRVLETFTRYTWPGNIRELKNVVERLVILYGPNEIRQEHAEAELSAHLMQETGDTLFQKTGDLNKAVALFEKEFIKRNLKKYPHLDACAQAMGIHRTTLARKIKRYGIDTPVPLD